MLHILFLILKIIGIILLVILGIALIFVGTVLFVPVRYRLKAETTNGLKGLRLEAKATWLFHLISAYAVYRNEELEWQARIAWKKLNVEEKEPVRKEKVQGIKSENNSKDDSKKQTVQELPKEAKPKREKKPKEKVNWLEKIKCTIQKFCDKMKKIKEFITDEVHLQALLCLKNELVMFLRKIKPDKLKGYLRFGLDDPYNTGRVLAVLSILYPFYGENIEIYPEFEKEILEGDIWMKGRIHLIHLVTIVCRLYFDKNIKVAYNNFKAL